MFEVRRCRLRDIPSLRHLLKTSFHEAHDHILGPSLANRVGGRLYSGLNLAAAIALSSRRPRTWRMILAAQDNVALGAAMAQLDSEESEIILYTLYVHPQWHRRGVGSALLRAVVASFPGTRAIRLKVLKENAAALAWYKAKGFEIYGETKNATNTPNVAAFYMHKRVEPTAVHQA